VHGVLPSSRWYSASSRRIQFHRVHVGDSGAVVTPFVQVATYATRNFATLGQLELLPPFTGASIQSLSLFLPTFQHRAGVRLYTSCYHLAESCVFNKQSLPPGMCRFPSRWAIYYRTKNENELSDKTIEGWLPNYGIHKLQRSQLQLMPIFSSINYSAKKRLDEPTNLWLLDGEKVRVPLPIFSIMRISASSPRDIGTTGIASFFSCFSPFAHLPLISATKRIGEHPFSRSYGVILPSSFDMVLSSALVYSTCSPVSVWGTVS
jgi:hypothetical protein